MKNTYLVRMLVALALSCGIGSALAEDIDIYSSNTSVTPGAPNVLIVLDNTANWSQSFASSTKFAAEMTALAQVVNALKTQFNLGIMMFTETGSPNSTTDGGYVRFAIQGMTQSDGTATDARNCLLKMVGSGSTCVSTNTNYSLLDIINDKSNGGKAGVTMGEVYDYFRGINAYAGNNKTKADPLAFLSGSIAGPQYKSPITESCQKNFVIVISNGAFQDNSSDTSTATSQLNTAGGNTAVINPPDNGSSNNNESDEWVRFLNKVSTVAAVTYTLEVGPSTTGQGPYNTALLQSMGTQGKGGYFSAVDAATLNAALTRIFNDIQAVNSVFASASLPLSSDNTGAFLNQVYMGVFRPDGGGKPRWLGNVKQYAFAVDSNKNLYLVDSLGAAAAGAAGFATPDAVSFWTSKDTSTAPDAASQTSTSAANGSTNGFWFFDSKGSGGNFDSQDGEWVEKGGAAQQLRLAYLGYGGRGGIGDNNDSTVNSKPARQVLTCIGSCLTGTTALTPSTSRATTWFEVQNTAIDSSALGLVNTSSVSSIVNAAFNVSTLATGPSIASIVASSNKATVTTTVDHGFADGDSVTISGSNISAYNGTWTINITGGMSSKQFSIANTSFSNGNPASASAGTAAKNYTTGSAKAFVTATAHGLTTGQKVVVSGATPLGFNAATATAITVLDVNTFTYNTLTPVSGVATGTITYTGNTARATTAAPHGFANNASVTISGVTTPTVYNGTFTIRNVTSTTFDYSYSGVDPIQANATTATGISATNTTGSIRDSLVRWVRGLDTSDENGFKVNGADTDVRASIHGDVLHSRPIVLNYSASSSSNNVYVFYGGNDGIYRAIKGGQASSDGKEQWAFIPQEFFPKFQRLYNNSPQVLYPSTTGTITPKPTKRDYTFDGPVGSYIHRDSTGAVDKAILYIAVRRGGRFIYALDVTTPTAPKFLWRKSSTDAGFSELGQTWSQPVVAKINSTSNPLVLIFGAGYDDASEDSDTPAATDTKGRGIFVLDALTGAPVWAAGPAAANATFPAYKQVAGMDFSIASDVQVIDRTLDGIADRIYAVDVGANVWRVDINNASPSAWAVWKIAVLGDRSKTNAARKLLFSPDVVFGTSFDAIIVGTGDREHPLATSTFTNGVANRFYMIKDTNTGTTGASLALTDTCGVSVGSSCSDFFDATSGSAVPSNAKGWSVNLATGEKVVNGPLVTAGNVIFGTNQPDTSNTTCTANLGIARRYDVNYLTGLGAGAFKDANGNVVLSEVAVGGGFLPSPVSGVVEIGNTPYLFTTDNPLNPGGVIPINVTVSQKRNRTYWREKLE